MDKPLGDSMPIEFKVIEFLLQFAIIILGLLHYWIGEAIEFLAKEVDSLGKE